LKKESRLLCFEIRIIDELAPWTINTKLLQALCKGLILNLILYFQIRDRAPTFKSSYVPEEWFYMQDK